MLPHTEVFNVTENDMENIDIYNDVNEGNFNQLTFSECVNMRDSLIAVTDLMLSNRSKELITMTLKEAETFVKKKC